MIARIESGQVDISQSKVKAFASALNTSIDYLMDGKTPINDFQYRLQRLLSEKKYSNSVDSLLLKSEISEIDCVKQAETALSALPTEDDIISFLEMFREGYASQELTNAALLDAFVMRAEVRPSDILVYFRIKKEDRQTIADLPTEPECSYSSVKWTCGDSIRTLYYTDGWFMLSIPA